MELRRAILRYGLADPEDMSPLATDTLEKLDAREFL
jgi:hypothetical protein